MRTRNRWQAILVVLLAGVAGGTQAQLRSLGDKAPGSDDSFPLQYGVGLKAAYFDGVTFYLQPPCRFWTTDGTEAGTLPSLDACALPDIERASGVMALNGFALLQLDRPFSTGSSVAWSDGSLAGTTELSIPDARYVTYTPWATYPGFVLLTVERTDGMFEVWSSSGTQASTVKLATTGSTRPGLVEMHDRSLAILGDGLWRASGPDSSPASVLSTAFTGGTVLPGTVQVDTRVRPARLLFTASTPGSGSEPWISDMTVAGTTQLSDLVPGPGSSSLSWGATPLPDEPAFFIQTQRLYRVDGATISPVSAAGQVVIPPVLALDDGVVVMTVLQDDGRRIWKYRPAVADSFAPVPGLLASTEAATLLKAPLGWPGSIQFPSGTTMYRIASAAAPADAALTAIPTFMSEAFAEGTELRTQMADIGVRAGTSALHAWRRDASAVPAGIPFTATPYSTTRIGVPGGSVLLGVLKTPTAGSEMHALDLVPHELPVCSSPNRYLPDDSPGGVLDSVRVLLDGLDAGDRILDLRVYLDLSHSWLGDVNVDLLHVDSGTEVSLLRRPGQEDGDAGCSSNDARILLDDAAARTLDECVAHGSGLQSFERFASLRPAQPLAAFIGKHPAGEWRLHVSDNASGDFGGLSGWCVQLTVGPRPTGVFRDGFE